MRCGSFDAEMYSIGETLPMRKATNARTLKYDAHLCAQFAASIGEEATTILATNFWISILAINSNQCSEMMK